MYAKERTRKAQHDAYGASAKGKEAVAAYQASAKGKATLAAYQASVKGKAAVAAYGVSPKGKKRAAQYQASAKGKAAVAAYQGSGKGKKRRVEYENEEERKAAKKLKAQEKAANKEAQKTREGKWISTVERAVNPLQDLQLQQREEWLTNVWAEFNAVWCEEVEKHDS